MGPEIKRKLDNLIDTYIGKDEVEGLTDAEQAVLLLEEVFEKLEELKDHTHTLY